MGDLPYVKDSGNFGRNSNGKVRFGFFRPEYSESPLEVVHLFRSQYFGHSILTNIAQLLFTYVGNSERK